MKDLPELEDVDVQDPVFIRGLNASLAKVHVRFVVLNQLPFLHCNTGQETWPVRTSETGNFSIRTRKKMIQVVRLDKYDVKLWSSDFA